MNESPLPVLQTLPSLLFRLAFGFGFAVIATAAAPQAARAQQGRIPTKLGPISASGTITLSAEAYGTSGVNARRDPLSSKAQINLLAQATRHLSYGINLALSTEQVNFGQQLNTPLNRTSFDLRYRFMEFSAGNIAPSLSKYTLQGTTIKGGAVSMNPGPLRLSLIAGRAQEAAQPGPDLGGTFPQYERNVFAGKLGLGAESGTHFHLIGLYGDDLSDSIQPTPLVDPAENVNLATDFGFSLLDRKVTLKGLTSVSLYTGDTSGEKLDVDVPEGLTLTTSTRASVAGEFDLSIRLKDYQLRTGYERIQPGYATMGLLRAKSDQERIQAQLRMNLMDRKLRLGIRVDQTRNNLMDQLSATRARRRLGLDAQAQVSEPLSLGMSYNGIQNEVNLAATATRGAPRDLRIHTVTVTPGFTLTKGETRHTATAGATLQWGGDSAAAEGSQAARAAEQQSAMLTLSYILALPSKLAINATTNLASVEVGETRTGNTTLNVSASRPYLEEALRITLGAGYARTALTLPPTVPQGGKIIIGRQTLNASAQWTVPFGGDLQLQLQGLNASQSGGGMSYQEIQTSLTYRRRL